MVRATVLLALLGGLAWWLHGEQSRGRFQKVDDAFLELLLANTRERFVPDLTRADEVVFLPLKEEEKAEYAGWPPLPVDYQMILKGALMFEPSVVVLVDPMRWPEPKPAIIPELADLLLPVPAVVMTASSGAGDVEEGAVSRLQQRLASLTLSRGESGRLPKLEGSLLPPELRLLRVGDPSLLVEGEGKGVPLLFSQGGQVRAAPALLGFLRSLKVPVSSVRVALGGGAGVLAGTGVFVPLLEDGRLQVADALVLNEQNALDLMTVSMLDDPASELPKKMGRGRVLVIGTEREGHHVARDQARALAHALALPRLQVLPALGQYIAWGVVALLGISLLGLPKTSALKRALLYLFFALVACYLAFQVKLIWLSPAVPSCLLLASGLFARLFGRKPATRLSHG